MANLDESMDLNATLNISSGTFVASTPFKRPGSLGRKGGKKKTFVRPICDTCDVCGKEYRCHRSYKNHMRQNAIKDAALKFPSVSQIIDHCSSAVFVIVQLLSEKPAYGQMGGRYKALLQNILENPDSTSTHPEWNECFSCIHEILTEDLGEQKMLLPYVMLGTLIKNNENLLTDCEKRKELSSLLEVCVVSDQDVLNCFVADYSSLLMHEIFQFYCRCVKSAVQDNVDNQEAAYVRDFEDKETVHFIGGSVVRGFYKKSQLFPDNKGWKEIGKVIEGRFLESESMPGPPDSVKGWTKSRSRGKLFFVSGLLFDFFIGVTEILESQKNVIKGKVVDSSAIIENVCNGCLVLLWDEIVGDRLSEKASYELMCGVVRSFCNTYGVGKSKKIMNKIRATKAEASIALRPSVAPRSK